MRGAEGTFRALFESVQCRDLVTGCLDEANPGDALLDPGCECAVAFAGCPKTDAQGRGKLHTEQQHREQRTSDDDRQPRIEDGHHHNAEEVPSEKRQGF